MELFFVVLIGLCIGSFLNVCIYRIAREESISFPPSHCTSCGYQLKVKDLIPVLSYIFLGGKCIRCKDKISIKYPLVEILNVVLYVLIYFKFGMAIELFKYCLLASLLIVIAVIDLETKYVFSSTIVFGIITGIGFTLIKWFQIKEVPIDNIIGATIGFLIIWLIVKFTGGMGEGDIDIALISGLFLGIKGILVTLFIAFISGGIVAIIILAFKIKGRKSEIAFGPYLAIGAVVAMLWGDQLLSLYGSLFL